MLKLQIIGDCNSDCLFYSRLCKQDNCLIIYHAKAIIIIDTFVYVLSKLIFKPVFINSNNRLNIIRKTVN